MLRPRHHHRATALLRRWVAMSPSGLLPQSSVPRSLLSVPLPSPQRQRPPEQLLQEHGALPEPVAGRYTYQILLGLEYLHNRGIAHRDIKGANVLIGADGQCKLADFGASKSVEASSIVSGLKVGGWALFSYCYLLGPSIALIVLGGYTLLLLPPAPPY